MYATHRHTHFPTLYIRPACVEDSDDLLPILVEHSHNITSLYGKVLPDLTLIIVCNVQGTISSLS